MAAVSTDFVKLNELTAEKEETEKLLEEKMDRWMYLEELAARIAEQYWVEKEKLVAFLCLMEKCSGIEVNVKSCAYP